MGIIFEGTSTDKPRLAVCLCRVGTLSGDRQPWGEERLALGLAKYLTTMDLCSNVTLYGFGEEGWDADIVVTFHHNLYTKLGKGGYFPEHAIKIIWILLAWENPQDIIEWGYDRIFCSSARWCKQYRLEYLPMCFWGWQEINLDYDQNYAHDIVFVGNGNCHRDKAPLLYQLRSHRLKFYGKGWEYDHPIKPMWVYSRNEWLEFFAEHYGGILPSDKVETTYYSSKLVLGLTQPLWKKLGMITTRVFEAISCRATVIHDWFPEMDEFVDIVEFFRDPDELVSKAGYLLRHPHQQKGRGGIDWLRDRGYTIDRVATKMVKV